MQRKYVASLCLALLENLMYSGILYGWPFLVDIFQEEGYFGELCNSTAPAASAHASNGSEESHCLPQTERFNLIYTLGSVVNVLFCSAAGLMFDRFGTWLCKGVSTCLYLAGLSLLASSSPHNADLLYPAMVCLAVGSSLMFMSNYQFANLFKSTRSTWIAMFNGLFISSSFVFWIFSRLHRSGTPVQTLFASYTAPLVVLFLLGFFLAPRGQIPYPPPKGFRYGVEVTKRARARKFSLPTKKLSADLRESGFKPRPPRLAVTSALGAFLYLMNFFQMSAMNLRNQFFTGTFNAWAPTMGEGNVAELTTAFSLISTISGFAAPLVGLLDDVLTKYYRRRCSSLELARMKSSNAFTLFSSLSTIVLSLCAVVPLVEVQYLTFGFLTVSKLVCYSYSYISITTHYEGGQAGMLVGVLWAMSGAVLALQYPMLRFVLRSCDGDFGTVNVIFLVLNILTLAFPVALYWTHSRVVAIVTAPSPDLNGNTDAPRRPSDHVDLLQSNADIEVAIQDGVCR